MQRPMLGQKISRALILSAGVLAFGRSAHGADVDPGTRAAARALATDGVAAFQKGDIEVGSSKLEKAYRLLQVPSIGLWSARALAKRGKLVDAAERYLETTRLSGFKGEEQVQKDAQRDAASELPQLTARIPLLIVQVTGSSDPNLLITLDGAPFQNALLGEQRPVNPGEHRLEAHLGERHAEQSVTLAEAQHRTVVLHLSGAASETVLSAAPALNSAEPRASEKSAPGEPPADQRESRGIQPTLGYVALAVGGAGLVVGTVAGVLAIGKKNKIDDSADCKAGNCLPAMRSTVDSLNSLRSVSTIGFVTGGVFAAAGVGLLLTAPSNQHDARTTQPGGQVAVRLAFDSVAITGSF